MAEVLAEQETETSIIEWLDDCLATFMLTSKDNAGRRLFAQLSELHDKGLLGTDGELESARGAAVALEQELAALAETLELFTHEAVDTDDGSGYCRSCGSRVDDARHRTPAFLRKRYGLGV